MKKLHFATVAAVIALGYANPTSDREEVVFVKGADGEPLRISKSDFDADQASDKPQYTEHKGKLTDEQQGITSPASAVPPMAAPSAPDFSGDDQGTDHIDPLKNAVAPQQHGENSRLVLKDGKKYYAVDGQTGEKLTTDQLGGVENGFASEELAWTAIRALPH